MDIQTILAYLIFLICVLVTIRGLIKSLKKKKDSGCGCGCSGCSMAKKDKFSSNCCAEGEKQKNN